MTTTLAADDSVTFVWQTSDITGPAGGMCFVGLYDMWLLMEFLHFILDRLMLKVCVTENLFKNGLEQNIVQ